MYKLHAQLIKFDCSACFKVVVRTVLCLCIVMRFLYVFCSCILRGNIHTLQCVDDGLQYAFKQAFLR